jgi:hypothetical protein
MSHSLRMTVVSGGVLLRIGLPNGGGGSDGDILPVWRAGWILPEAMP